MTPVTPVQPTAVIVTVCRGFCRHIQRGKTIVRVSYEACTSTCGGVSLGPPQRSSGSPVASFNRAPLARTVTFENIEEITHDRR